MKVITSMEASLAINTLCETPGLIKAGLTLPTTAAAAIAGLKPARIISGISVGPTAAQQPAVDGIAMETKPVTAQQAGRRKMPNRFNGFVNKETKCTSHLVIDTTPAKPIAEQIAMISVAAVIDLSNC